MKKIPDKLMCILALAVILLFGITTDYAHGFGTRSFDFILIGTIIPSDEEGNTKTYELWTDDDTWRFTVTKARVTTRASVTGSRLLMDIFPRKIKLLGPDRILAPLKQPEIVGKSFELGGRLYIQSRLFNLNRVEEVREKWRIKVNHSAKSDGTIVFRVSPEGQPAIVVTVEIKDGTKKRKVAAVIRDALKDKLPKDGYHVKRDNFVDVLIKPRPETPDFGLEIVSNSVQEVSITLHRE
jgi:hypothetical protein